MPGAAVTPKIPLDCSDLTPGWFSAILGVQVHAADVTRIGEDTAFSGGSIWRVDLHSDAGPERLVVKLAPGDPDLRAAMAGANAREVALLARAAGWGAGQVPELLYTAVDRATGVSALVMKEVPDAHQIPFVVGGDRQSAEALVATLAQVHLTEWQKSDLAQFPGTGIADEFDFAKHWAEYEKALASILPGQNISSRLLGIGDVLARGPKLVLSQVFGRGPQTLLHRDVHLDNVMFAREGFGLGQALLIDWQFWAAGPGGVDLGYFLCSSFEPEIRRAIEADVVRDYARRLAAGGVTDYGVEHIWRDLRMAAVWKLFVTVLATCMFDNSTPARALWRQKDLLRLSAFVEDYDLSGDGLAKGAGTEWAGR